MATIREQLVFTPSPVRADGTSLRLSVHVGVRLQSDSAARTKLANFPDFVSFSKFLYGPKPWQFQVAFATGEVFQTSGFPTKPANLAGTVSVQMADPATPLFVDPLTGAPIANSKIQSRSLWGALFDGGTPVDPVLLVNGKPKPSQIDLVKLRSYPMDDLADFTLQQWIAVASAFPPDSHPKLDDVIGTGALRDLADQHIVGRTDPRQRLDPKDRRYLENVRDKTSGQGMSNPEYDAETLLVAKQYYDRSAPGDPWGASDPQRRLRSAFVQFSNVHRNKASDGAGRLPTKSVPDFHRVLAGLSRHPAVLRSLGLIFDLVITPQPGHWPLSGAFGRQMVQVLAAPVGASTKLSIHSTALHVNVGAQGTGIFTPFFKGDGENQANQGMLRLSDPSRFRVFTHDIDGAAVKTLHVANELLVKALHGARDVQNHGAIAHVPTSPAQGEVALASASQDVRTEETSTLPALRSGGIVVTEVQRTVQLAARLKRQFSANAPSFESIVAAKPNNNSGPSIASGAPAGSFVEFYGEDLVGGYRFDVFDATRKRWFTLMKRDQVVHFTKSTARLDVKVVGEESAIGTSMTRPVGTSEQHGYRDVRESLVRWSGWSLAGTRPGASLPQANMREVEVKVKPALQSVTSLGGVVPVTANGVVTRPVAVYPVLTVKELDGSVSTRIGAELADRSPKGNVTYYSTFTVAGVTSIKFAPAIQQHPGLLGATSVVVRFESTDVSSPTSIYNYVVDEPLPTAGTLPVLRFGRTYKLRARPLDICGNGIGFSTGDVGLPNLSSSPSVTYQRLEPVSPPKVLITEMSELTRVNATFGTIDPQGETVEHLVVRSVVQAPEDTLDAAIHPAQHAETQEPYLPSTRVVLAPELSEEEAELSGWVDGSTGTPDPSMYQLLGSLTPLSANPGKVAGQPLIAGPSSIAYLPDPAATGVAIYGIPHLGGARVIEVDDAGQPTVQVVAGNVLLIDYRRGRVPYDADPSGARYRVKPITLVLEPPTVGDFSWNVGSSTVLPISWDGQSATLTIRLTPGRRADLQLSSYVRGANSAGINYSSMFALPAWIDKSPVPQSSPSWVSLPKLLSGQQLRSSIESGRSWMVTPWRTIRLIHATTSPLVRPSFDPACPMVIERSPGSLTSTITGGILLHQPSTGKVDLTAAWVDFIDNGPGTPLSYLDPQNTPSILTFTPGSTPLPTAQSPVWGAASLAITHVGDVKVEDPHNDGISTFTIPKGSLVQRFGDTKHRKVSFSVAATTQFADNFTTTIQVDLVFPRDVNKVFTFAQAPSTHVVDAVAASVAVTVVGSNGAERPISSTTVDTSGRKQRNWKVLAGTTPLSQEPDGNPEAVAQGIVFPLAGLAPGPVRLRVTYLPAPAIVSSPPLTTAKPVDILNHVALGSAHAPNTRRPLPPKVLYGVPTFGWSSSSSRTIAASTTTSSRTTNGFRFFLERPWFSSGADELLGVIVDPQGFPPYDPTKIPATNGAPSFPAEWDLVSTWGIDPVGTTRGTLPGRFPTSSAFTNVALIDGAPAIRTTTLAEHHPNGATVKVLGFRPQYDPSRDLWYADVDMAVPSVYQPLVRLALVRYQPYAVADPNHPERCVDISRVVRADFLQLPANRTLVVSSPTFVLLNSTPTFQLTLTGPMASYDRPVTASLGWGTSLAVPSAWAFIEKQPKAMVGNMAGWTPISTSVVELTVASGPDVHDFVTWTGSLPSPTIDPNFNYRIVVEQYETYETGRTKTLAFLQVAEGTGRLIYHDTYSIT